MSDGNITLPLYSAAGVVSNPYSGNLYVGAVTLPKHTLAGVMESPVMMVGDMSLPAYSLSGSMEPPNQLPAYTLSGTLASGEILAGEVNLPFPLANGVVPVLGARFVDRIGKGIRGAPRDAMIADETPPEIRGAAFGLRQSLDTVGAFLAPLVAVGLMIALAGNIRLVFWIAVIPALLSFVVAWALLRETGNGTSIASKLKWGGFRDLDADVRRLIGIGFLFGLARFSEGFLILKAMDVGLSATLSPLVLSLFAVSYLLLAFPAGRWSDRIAPRTILLAGISMLVVADVWLAGADSLWMVGIGVVLWGAHMALTQGIFARMIADASAPERRATSFGAFFFASGIAALLASLGAGLLWDRSGPDAIFNAGAAIAAIAGAMLLLLPSAGSSGTVASGRPPARD